MKSLSRDLRKQLDEARLISAKFLGADPDGFAFARNATTGVNSVLASPTLHAGDEVLVTDQTYEAIKHVAEKACQSNNARLVVAKVSLPTRDSEQLFESIIASVTKKTRLAIIDHIASPTGLVYPVKKLIEELHNRNILVLVDAAHAPGMVDVNLDSLQPDFWTGNFHKWCCSPRGSAGLWVRQEHRKLIKSIITSWYYNEKYPDSFRWLGTDDYTSYLSVPEALRFMEGLGWERVRMHNRKLARYGREVVGAVQGMVPIKPEKDEELFEAMTLVRLPEGVADTEEKARALQARFGEELRSETVPIAWSGHGYLRLSAQVYNAPGEYDRLAEGLPRILNRQR
jgi:isopenicillin-N epimerase